MFNVVSNAVIEKGNKLIIDIISDDMYQLLHV